MDNYIAEICKEAERKLKARTEATEQELTIARLEIAKLTDRNAVLEARVQQFEKSIAENVSGEHDFANKLNEKYAKLKGSYEDMQARYRKERAIWKRWIEYFNHQEEKNLLVATTDSGTNVEGILPMEGPSKSVVPLSEVSPNARNMKQCSLQDSRAIESTNDRTVCTKQPHLRHSISTPNNPTTHDQGTHKYVKLEDVDHHSVLPSSSQDACSIDLDQVTIRKTQAVNRESMIEVSDSTPRPLNLDFTHLQENGSRHPDLGTDPLNSKRHLGHGANAIAEDSFSQSQEHIKSELCSSPLSRLLSTTGSALPGQRQSASVNDMRTSVEVEGEVLSSSQRNLKRTMSEAMGQHQGLSVKGHHERILSQGNSLNEDQKAGTTRKSKSMFDITQREHNLLPSKIDDLGVVRGSARKALHATDCACCTDFYRLAGPAAARKEPLWRSPPRQTRTAHPTSSKQQVGRHRSAWKRSPTPPEFWDSDFPTTQQLTREKQDNKLRRLRKLSYVEHNANS